MRRVAGALGLATLLLPRTATAAPAVLHPRDWRTYSQVAAGVEATFTFGVARPVGVGIVADYQALFAVRAMDPLPVAGFAFRSRWGGSQLWGLLATARVGVSYLTLRSDGIHVGPRSYIPIHWSLLTTEAEAGVRVDRQGVCGPVYGGLVRGLHLGQLGAGWVASRSDGGHVTGFVALSPALVPAAVDH